MQKERILQFLEYKGLSKNKFYIKTGISNGTLDKKTGISIDTIEKLYSIFPEINIEWLITGNGPMIKENAPPAPPNEDYNKLKDELIESQREVIRLQKEIAELKATKSHKHPAAGSMAGKLEKK